MTNINSIVSHLAVLLMLVSSVRGIGCTKIKLEFVVICPREYIYNYSMDYSKYLASVLRNFNNGVDNKKSYMK